MTSPTFSHSSEKNNNFPSVEMVLNCHVLYPCLAAASEPQSGQFEQVLPGVWSEWTKECRHFLGSHLEKCRFSIVSSSSSSSCIGKSLASIDSSSSSSSSSSSTLFNIGSVKWHAVTINNYQQVISECINSAKELISHPGMSDIIFVSLMDGSETDGWPGLSVVRHLEQCRVPYTGCSTDFFAKDVDKSVVKRYLPVDFTPGYSRLSPKSLVSVSSDNLLSVKEPSNNIQEVKLVLPVIVKTCYMSGSIGLSDESIIRTSDDLSNIPLDSNYYLEEFIQGREFTCFASGSVISSGDDDVFTLVPCERVFSGDLDPHQRFLSYDRKWVGWETEWWYAPVNNTLLSNNIRECAAEVFKHVRGDGYCRMDLRQRESDGRLFVVDLNCNCSIDGQDDTALGVMLKASPSPDDPSKLMSLTDLMNQLLKMAFQRSLRAKD